MNLITTLMIILEVLSRCLQSILPPLQYNNVREKIQKYMYMQSMHTTGNAGMWQGNYETDRKRMKINLCLQKG